MGIQSIEEIQPLIKNGVDEFFGGLLIKGLYSNARPPLSQYNFKNIDELRKALKIIVSNQKEFYLVINEPFEGKDFYKIEKIMLEAMMIGVHGFIISSIPLLNYLNNSKNRFGKLILSCLGLCLNKESIKFYRNLGINRIILTRQNKISEIKNMTTSFPDLEFESFGCFDKCNNLDELCRTSDFLDFKNKSHTKEGCLCHLGSTHELKFYENSKQIEKDENNIRKMINWHNGCGACYLKRLENSGIDAVKFASRGWSLEKKLHHLEVMNFARKLINTDITNQEYIEKVRSFKENKENSNCSIFDCYYKEDENSWIV